MNPPRYWTDEMKQDPDFFSHFTPEWLHIFENVPNVHFFIKDIQGRIMACNPSFAKLMGGNQESDILHKTAFELCSEELAIRYTEDDQRVFNGDEFIDKYEPNVGDKEGIYWYLTTKRPIRDSEGTIIGLMGLTRAISSESEFAEDVRPILDHIHENYAEKINFPTLAKSVNMSISSMERKFKGYFGISPIQYHMRYRVIKAAELLSSTNLTIAEIATEVGFYDQSTLTRHFQKHKSTTPHAYRQKSE